MTKVVHLQSYVSLQGNAPFRLHNAMLDAGMDSSMIVFNTPKPGTKRFYRFGGVNRILKTFIYGLLQKMVRRKIRTNPNLFSFPYIVGNDVSGHPLIADADVIYLHWINGGFLSLRNLKKILALGKPVVFFMHDMWPITGGCHHSFDCVGYKSDCSHCPMFEGNKKRTYASIGMDGKKNTYSAGNLHFVSPSTWLQRCAAQSAAVSNKSIFCIPNVISEKVFKKVDKAVARQILGIEQSAHVISFGCVAGVNNPIKGWQYFESALKKIKTIEPELNITVLIFGSEFNQEIAASLPYNVQFLGQVNDEISMVVINNAADVFVSPSLAESFGMTAMENVMCGTPVVAFNNGGTVDFIKHKTNGYLADYQSANDLAEGIIFCLKNIMSMVLSSEFSTASIINNHRQLFKLIQKPT